MAKYRPKHYVLYRYGTAYKVDIDCYPQSRWELIFRNDREVVLNNKHTTIHLSTEDFEKRWVEVKNIQHTESIIENGLAFADMPTV